MFEQLAALPNLSKGRFYKEFEKDFTRSPFERDRSRVIHSSSFRKLKFKTQITASHIFNFVLNVPITMCFLLGWLAGWLAGWL